MPEDGPTPAVAADVLGLGREVDGLRRALDRQRGDLGSAEGRLGDTEERLGSLGRMLADLSEQLAELVASELEPGPHRSWFEVTDLAGAESRLTDLALWLDQVYFRFPDAVLPSCWLWHPSVVEELLWLHRSWTEAFSGKTAAVFRVADWHDRQRPGVVARIKALNDGVCTIDQHVRGAERDTRPPTVLAVDAVHSIADWWARRREESPPYPTDAQLAEAEQRR